MAGPPSLTVSTTPTKTPRKSILRARQPARIRPLPRELTALIPPEVIDLIIEKVASFDIPTLAVCSLVCKTWLAASRQRLFAAIPVTLNPRNAGRFVRLLDSKDATIGWGVRHVSVQYSESASVSFRDQGASSSYRVKVGGGYDGCCGAGATEDPNEDSDYYDLPWDEGALLCRLAKFKALTSLSFSWVSGGFDQQTTMMLTQGHTRLTELEFRACTFPSFGEFTGIICALQNLRRVALTDVAWKDKLLPGDNAARGSPRRNRQCLPQGLKAVELYIYPIGHFVTWLGSYSADLVELDTVRLCSIFWDDVDTMAISWFLKRFARRVRHLSLPWHLPEVNLLQLSELRSLHFSHLLQPVSPEAQAEEYSTPRGIEYTLQQISSPYIETIQFRIQSSSIDPPVLNFDWVALSGILAHSTFARLQDVSFGIPVHDKKLRNILRRIWAVPVRRHSDYTSQRRSVTMPRSPKKTLSL